VSTTLKGMTWDHARGYDPMEACSAQWKALTGVEITWDRRSLQDFESYPVEELAQQYDLIVIDHPHVGQITRSACLRPFETSETHDSANGAVGASFVSYNWDGRQWALPIDAASQVLAFRPDRLGNAPRDWDDILELARAGRVALPMRAPHSLMCLYTLCAQMGAPARIGEPLLFDESIAADGCERLRALMQCVDPACYTMDPIAVFEQMAQMDSTIDCVPLIYGYVSYAADGFRPARIQFADMPLFGNHGPIGSALGGTGIAVSSLGPHVPEAAAFAVWIASGDVQRGLFAHAGGQPAHLAAWDDTEINVASHEFYRATRATLDHAWVRPRHDGYMPFQHAASVRLSGALPGTEPARSIVRDINDMYCASSKASR
jgi:multiple sugar transport system substrate-binding protein